MSPKKEKTAATTVDKLQVAHSGWVLKKKKKKMQGYAKRFLILTKEGVLTYSIDPSKPIRDSIEVPHASVTSSARHGSIHVDSGATVFHLKMLNEQDFESWRTQLRSFIPERSASSPHRIYVASNSGRDLVSVDLNPVFDCVSTTQGLTSEIQTTVQKIRDQKLDQKGITDHIFNMLGPPTMDGLIQMFTPGSSDGKKESPFASLAVLVEQLAAEQANLKHLIETRIPKIDGAADGSMDSIKSNMYGGTSRSRMSFSSFHTTQDAAFYDSEAAGDEYVLDDSAGDASDRTYESSNNEDTDENDDDDSGGDDDAASISTTVGKKGDTEWRTQLPAKVSGDEVSLFSMLKKNVGKDLSTISFPVSFNCPLSLLQASAEEYEYAPELLGKASKTQDWVERICLVGAFAVSGYASTKLRASRKPFNPLLGETFECVLEDKGMRFLAEKVVHQPPLVASYAEGKGWQCEGWNTVKNKFWGKSLELIPEGHLRLSFDDGDVFTFQKPSSFMRNLLAGNKYLEHVGELTVTNENTGQRLVIDFKEGNMWGGSSSRNAVSGIVYDEKGKEVTKVKGKWSESLQRQKEDEHYQLLWEANDLPPQAEDYYGFTQFAITLNDLPDRLKPLLPRSDSRFRPDQRAFENGDVDTAEKDKARLETAQRERRKALEAKGGQWEPKWFHKDGDGWAYGPKSGQDEEAYFKLRKKVVEKPKESKKIWKDVPDIFA